VQDGVDRSADMDVVGDVGTDQAESRVLAQVGHISRRRGGEIVQAQHLITPRQQALAQV
jgi:hypothetical protein